MSKKFIKSLSTIALASALVASPIAAVTVPTQYGTVVRAQENHEEHVLRWVTSAEIPTLDSAKVYDSVSFFAVGQIAEGLVKLSKDGTVVPAGAEALPEVSEDGLVYTFKLRQDAKWSNGEPVTAKDYVYAWKRAVNPDTGSANAFVFFDIKNGEAVNKGEKPVDELGVEAVGDYELKVTLEKPIPNFLNIATGRNYSPQHQEFVEKAGEAYGTSSDTVLGNGPFTIEGWDSTALSWKYVKNPHYHSKDDIQLDAVAIEVVKDPSTAINLFEAGELDAASVSGALLAEYKQDERLLTFPGTAHNYIEFGISSSTPLQNQDLREAFSLVIDRDALTENILSGGAVKVKGLVPNNVIIDPVTGKDYVEGQTDFSTFDIEKAKEHWAKAKEALGTDNVELELLLTDNDTARKIGEYVQGQVESNLEGFKIKLRPLPAKSRFEKMMSFDFDIALGGWGPSNGDASELLVNFLTNATHNHAQFFDPEFDALVEKVDSLIGKPEERLQALYDAENYLLERKVLVPLIQPTTNILVSPEIENLEVIPSVGVDFTTIKFK